MSKVFIYECQNYEEKNVEKAIKQIVNSFDVIKDIKPKTKVVIKANLVSAMDPNKAATTHYILLKYLTKYFLDKDCKVTIGDSPGGVFTKNYLNHVYKVTKMDMTGAELNDNFSTTKGVFANAKILKSFEYTSYLDNADMIINFCKLKSHGMMCMSATVKNLFGVIPGTMKPEYHYRFPKRSDFANMLIDLNEYFKPTINIVDAVIGMEGNGPTMGDARHIGLILAGANPYELDYICAKVIGLDINDVETIKQSYGRNLFSPNNIELNAKLEKYILDDFLIKKDLNSIVFFENRKGWFNKIIYRISNKIFTNKPYLKKKKCIGCGKCASICPAKAIEMVNKKPKINRDKCIKCYCCQEFCPIGAMVVKSSVIAKILHSKKR